VILKRLFGRKAADPTDAVYATIVAAARQPRFFTDWGIPDTMDGRFEMMVMHTFLAMDRLRNIGSSAEPFSQALVNRFFAEMDAALREAGVGDLGVGKKVRKMAEAFYGRAAAYREGMSSGEHTLQAAVARNIFGVTESPHAATIAQWMMRARTVLARHDLNHFEVGHIRFE
jgi:cytochrome b pre-mRNA-processing protein 3